MWKIRRIGSCVIRDEMTSNVVPTSSVKNEVPKFDGGTSFSLCKIRMRSSLIPQGLWKAVEENFFGVSEESKVELQERALSAIFMSVTDNVLREIATEKTASDAWKKLEELYSGKSLTNRLYLKKRLYNLRMVEGTPVKQHLDVFNSIIMDLGNIDITVESEDQALIVLSSLPASYESFVDTLLYGKDTISLDDVSNALKSKELKKSYPDGRDVSETHGLAAWGGSQKDKRSEGRSKSKGKTVSCFECHEKGHYKRDCPMLRKGKEQSAGAAVSGSAVNHDDFDIGEVLSVNIGHGEDSWILNSGATFHMCPHKTWFVDYRPMSGIVYVGDGSSSSIEGAGSIRLRMSDGVIRTMECWHVPGIKRCLISLSTLDSHGYRYHARRGVLKVCKGSRTFMRGSLTGGQYVLHGSAIAGEATAVTSESRDHDPTLVWPRRFGQRSEDELQALGKQNLMDGYGGTTVLPTMELEYVHADLWGPFGVALEDGSRYVMTLIDDYSRVMWACFLRTDREALPTFVAWKTMVEKQAGRNLSRLRAGNGLDVCQGAFVIFCSTVGIVYHCTDAWKSPQPRGTAERTNEVPCDRARGVLSQYRAEAWEPACFLEDSSPSYTIECRASFAGMAGSHVGDSHWMREFGCPKRVRVRDGQRELGTGPCVYLGYASEAEVLWCNDEIASADMIDGDVTSIELVLKANEQRKMAIAGPDRGSKKQGVELGDAKQSSSEGSEQQHMESTIDGDRRQTKSQVVEDLQEANRRIDTKSERFGAFSGESLGHWLLGVRKDSRRDLLAKNKAEHESVQCMSVYDSIEDAM